jgi:hypothetical protein
MGSIVPHDLPFDCVLAAASTRSSEMAKKLSDKILKGVENKSMSLQSHVTESFFEAYFR